MTAPETYRLPRYLKAKKSVDARALNRRVWTRFLEEIDECSSLRILEVGAGVGATAKRIVRALNFYGDWSDRSLQYTLVDRNQAVLETASSTLRTWAKKHGFDVSGRAPQVWSDGASSVAVEFVVADLFDVAESYPGDRFDAIVGQALFDLLPIPDALRALRPLLRDHGLWYLPIHFDGVTAFEPPLDSDLDARIETLYHESMETNREGGRSGAQSGRRLLTYFRGSEANLLAAGGSDWIVRPRQGAYPADEAYFLYHILHFIESELRGHPGLDDEAFSEWLSVRRRQVEEGELMYIAHHLDVLARRKD